MTSDNTEPSGNAEPRESNATIAARSEVARLPLGVTHVSQLRPEYLGIDPNARFDEESEVGYDPYDEYDLYEDEPEDEYDADGPEDEYDALAGEFEVEDALSAEQRASVVTAITASRDLKTALAARIRERLSHTAEKLEGNDHLACYLIGTDLETFDRMVEERGLESVRALALKSAEIKAQSVLRLSIAEQINEAFGRDDYSWVRAADTLGLSDQLGIRRPFL